MVDLVLQRAGKDPGRPDRSGFPCSSMPRTSTVSARHTSPWTPGTLRHPSTPMTDPFRETISGLTTAKGAIVSSTWETSRTTTRFPTPTCGAASPIPSAAYIVSNMSRTRSRIRSSTAATGTAFRARNGSG